MWAASVHAFLVEAGSFLKGSVITSEKELKCRGILWVFLGVIPLAVPRMGVQPVLVLTLLQWGLEVLV